ncbi:MAG TPA: hypothetical protein VEP90_18915 [Methylomirabilota bacterium]|nr:hypothetical protein [Methylomirabilota bacterium]
MYQEDNLVTLQDYCQYLGWNVSKLAKEAGITWRTASKAIFQDECSSRTALKIVEALSKAMKKDIYVGDLDDLKIL